MSHSSFAIALPPLCSSLKEGRSPCGSFELEFAEGLRVLWPAIGKGDGFGIEAARDRLSVPTPLTR